MLTRSIRSAPILFWKDFNAEGALPEARGSLRASGSMYFVGCAAGASAMHRS